MMMTDPYLPHEAIIEDRIQESPTIFTLRLRFSDPNIHQQYHFQPGQFNMLYLFGVGEIAISIVSDPLDEHYYDHTIRILGRVTQGFAKLKKGDRIGVRGPFGRGWPLTECQGKDIIIVTGGLGCAPVVAAINYIIFRRQQFGKLFILQGVKHSDDLIYRGRYNYWQTIPNTTVLLSADQTSKNWPWLVGNVVELLKNIEITNTNSVAFMCGPEIMMHYAAKTLLNRDLKEESIYLSMERNMHCAVAHCGHCQFGGKFICKDGPVFNYSSIKTLFNIEGF